MFINIDFIGILEKLSTSVNYTDKGRSVADLAFNFLLQSAEKNEISSATLADNQKDLLVPFSNKLSVTDFNEGSYCLSVSHLKKFKELSLKNDSHVPTIIQRRILPLISKIIDIQNQQVTDAITLSNESEKDIAGDSNTVKKNLFKTTNTKNKITNISPIIPTVSILKNNRLESSEKPQGIVKSRFHTINLSIKLETLDKELKKVSIGSDLKGAIKDIKDARNLGVTLFSEYDTENTPLHKTNKDPELNSVTTKNPESDLIVNVDQADITDGSLTETKDLKDINSELSYKAERQKSHTTANNKEIDSTKIDTSGLKGTTLKHTYYINQDTLKDNTVDIITNLKVADQKDIPSYNNTPLSSLLQTEAIDNSGEMSSINQEVQYYKDDMTKFDLINNKVLIKSKINNTREDYIDVKLHDKPFVKPLSYTETDQKIPGGTVSDKNLEKLSSDLNSSVVTTENASSYINRSTRSFNNQMEFSGHNTTSSEAMMSAKTETSMLLQDGSAGTEKDAVILINNSATTRRDTKKISPDEKLQIDLNDTLEEPNDHKIESRANHTIKEPSIKTRFDHIVEKIKEHIQLSHNTNKLHTLKLTVDSTELGKIDLRVTVHNSTISADFTFDNLKGLIDLKENINSLFTSLQQEGFSPREFSFNLRNIKINGRTSGSLDNHTEKYFTSVDTKNYLYNLSIRV